jgi:nucleoside-diphosphate-sugar epimerase
MVGRSTVAALASGGRCRHVVCMDIMPQPPDFAARARAAERDYGCTLQYLRADITDETLLTDPESALQLALKAAKVECMVHVAALVGPFFPTPAYRKVNYVGTLNVLEACRVAGIRAVVDCSSPSTRFNGDNIQGMDEDEVWASLGGKYQGLHEYATTKAMGEGAVLAAAVQEAQEGEGEGEGGADPRWLCTCAVAPHQVYGPSDRLFLPALLRSARKGVLRVMGNGDNCVSFTNEANISHGLLLAAGALCAHAEWRRKRGRAGRGGGDDACTPAEIALGRAGARVNGEFMVVTDATPEMPMGLAINFWDAVDDATARAGLGAIRSGCKGRCRLPYYGLLLPIAYAGKLFTMLTGRFVNITPFTVKMLVIDRYFDIGKARTLLGYEPLVNFYDEERGWNAAIDAAFSRIKKEDGF